ncbi:concanavalin A-like lectin/glucanase [Lophium mytilinum]|uniref:Concanavalin A-like lectin/glucanase n=1 Tax=Lophium mytilinum TaxID=390894 RepID=A0A6A6QT01_9PEZI|nr:concanavalin A-like lectin/glucanase [Lophium mytilinum]
MYISLRRLRAAAAYSAIALSAVQAQNVIDQLSFGNKGGQLSPDGRGIQGWKVSGEGHTPNLMSDRIILTPPYPGNMRGAVWSNNPTPYSEWTAEFRYRASGPERGGGNLQIWYSKDGQQSVGMSSLYTAPAFDGLVMVVDQYKGMGGSVRGFLNDGTVTYKDHHSVDSLSFGQCNYPYRNMGRFSTIQLKQTADYFQVTIDKNPCFRTDKVRLPAGYYFGVSAASAENPDSFEAQSFEVSVPNGAQQQQGRTEPPPPREQYQQYPPPPQQQQQKYQAPPSDDIPQQLSDQLAANIKNQQDQFADLHNRLQIVNHQVNNIFQLLENLAKQQDQRHQEVMNRAIPTHDRVDAISRNVEKVERIVLAIQRDVEGKDYQQHLTDLQNAIKVTQTSLTEGLPLAMSSIVTGAKPRMGLIICVFVAVQIMVIGAWQVYKKRRNSAPKKYL